MIQKHHKCWKKLPNEYSDLKEFIIDLSDFVKLDVLGKGSFGTVWKAQHITNGWIVAIKEFSFKPNKEKDSISSSRNDVQNDSFNENEFFCEVRILSKCTNNPFLIQLVGFSIKGTYAIVTSFIPCGSLWDVLHPKNSEKNQSNEQQSQASIQNQQKSINDTQKTIIALGISYGLKYIHSQNIIHLDLKSPNILLNDRIIPQIADFGLSQIYNPQSKNSNGNKNELISSQKSSPPSDVTIKGTPTWMSPEQLCGLPCGPAADIFSFAIILYELYTEKDPYPGLSHAQIFYKVVKSKERPKLPENNSSLSRLISRCWESDPVKRPSSNEIFELFKSGEVSFPHSNSRYVIEVVKMIEKYEKSFYEAILKEASMVNQVISLRQMQKKFVEEGKDEENNGFEVGGENESAMGSKKYFMSCLTKFAWFGKIEEFDIYLSALPSLNLDEADDKGVTPIQAAIINDQLIMVQYLARLPNTKRKEGSNSNEIASNTNSNRLSDSDKKPNSDIKSNSSVDNNNSSPESNSNSNLHTKNYIQFDINATDSDGNTPFLLAVTLFKPRIVAYLGQLKKVNVNAQNNNGYSALHLMMKMVHGNEKGDNDHKLSIMMKALSFAKDLRVDLKDKEGKEAFEGKPKLLAEFTKRQEANKMQYS